MIVCRGKKINGCLACYAMVKEDIFEDPCRALQRLDQEKNLRLS